MVDPEHTSEEESLVSRHPTAEDLSTICKQLNELGSQYIVVRGFAIRGAGYLRETMDVDFVIDPSIENVAKVFKTLESLPDKAVLELKPEEVAEYTVIRIGDEIIINLMAKAGGYTYEDISADQIIREVNGVPIPFASPKMLYKMKELTRREKDRRDLHFLRTQYAEEIFGKD